MSRPQDAQALRGAVARCLAEGGLTQRKAAQRLRKSPQSVGYHARRLLAERVLAVKTGGKRGEFTTYAKGERWPVFEAALRGDKEADRVVRSPSRTLAIAHRGHRVFPVLAAPKDPSKAPGWQKTTKASGVSFRFYDHQDAKGQTWRFQFSDGRKKRSVTAYPPHVTLDSAAEVEAIPDWWDNWVEKEAHTWGNAAGFTLAARQGKKVQPVEVAIHAPGFPKTPDGHVQTVKVDGTPWPDGSLEGPPQVMAAVMRAHDTEARVGALERRLDACDARDKQHMTLFERLVAAIESQLDREEKVAEVLIARQERASVASESSLQGFA
ncbi:MAG: hypothetical protein LC623_08400 [Halobacteriales archaeon]|nr:hypothetical protein [Halobacteriales archaeon]